MKGATLLNGRPIDVEQVTGGIVSHRVTSDHTGSHRVTPGTWACTHTGSLLTNTKHVNRRLAGTRSTSLPTHTASTPLWCTWPLAWRPSRGARAAVIAMPAHSWRSTHAGNKSPGEGRSCLTFFWCAMWSEASPRSPQRCGPHAIFQSLTTASQSTDHRKDLFGLMYSNIPSVNSLDSMYHVSWHSSSVARIGCEI